MTRHFYTHVAELGDLLELKIFDLVTGSFEIHQTLTLPFNVLSFITHEEGNATLENLTGKECFTLTTGTAMIVPCHLEIRRDITESLQFIAVHFSLTLPGGMDLFAGCRKCICWREEQNQYVPEFQRIVSESSPVIAAARLKALVWQIACRFMPPLDQDKLFSMQKYLPLFRYVEENGNAELTVRQLAEERGMRPDVFSRTFRHDLGITPREFIHQHMAKRVTEELMMNSASLKEIAARLHFCSEFHLSHFYKKMTGMSPREFRRRNAFFRATNTTS